LTENNKYTFEQLNKTITTFQNAKKLHESSCKDHYLYIIKLLLKTRIYKACKWMRTEENINDYSYCNKKLPKLRILEHL
jgi:hypothetical protein